MDPGVGLSANSHIFQLLSHLSVAALSHFTEILQNLQRQRCFSSQKFNSNSFFSVCSFPPSAKLGHRLYRLCGDHPGVSVLLLRLQKMDIQEEKQKEGQRQGQKCHQHEGRQGWGQNRGKDFELSLKFRDISLRTC